MKNFIPFTGFDPIDGADPIMTYARDNPVSPPPVEYCPACCGKPEGHPCQMCGDNIPLSRLEIGLLMLADIIMVLLVASLRAG